MVPLLLTSVRSTIVGPARTGVASSPKTRAKPQKTEKLSFFMILPFKKQ
jgi:hypothetical protein